MQSCLIHRCHVQPRGSGLSPEVRRETWALQALPFCFVLVSLTTTTPQALSAPQGEKWVGLVMMMCFLEAFWFPMGF